MRILFQSIEHLTETCRQDRLWLEPNAIHLWGITLDGPQRCLERCAGWLDEVEQHRATRLVREDTRQHYVLAHGGLRVVLSRYLGVDPKGVTLARSARGKPFLTRELRERSAITFNLSHAHGRALIAVSKTQEVGVDLEFVRSQIEVAKLSKRYFACSEHAAIMQAPEDQRAARFFRYWVAKEALLKAEGIGLRGLAECEIVLGVDGVDTDVQARLGSQFTNPLRVRFLPCENGWEAAVAARSLDSVHQCGLE
jgi:4'-phosphopantetheinyl transferase